MNTLRHPLKPAISSERLATQAIEYTATPSYNTRGMWLTVLFTSNVTDKRANAEVELRTLMGVDQMVATLLEWSFKACK